LPSSNQVNVQPVHTLATLWAIIHDHAVSVREALLLGNLGDRNEKVAQSGLITIFCIAYSSEGLFGEHQDVNRSNRVDIMESKHVIVLEDLLAGDLSLNDLGEDGILGSLLEDLGSGALLSGHGGEAALKGEVSGN